MLTVCAYFDCETMDLIGKIQDVFASSDIKMIAYAPHDFNYNHPDVTVINVAGFQYPQTSILLEVSNEVEQTLFIFDITGWLEKQPESSITIRGDSIKNDLDIETLYDDCFQNEDIQSSIQHFLDAVHV
jgi:hypothetical protein